MPPVVCSSGVVHHPDQQVSVGVGCGQVDPFNLNRIPPRRAAVHRGQDLGRAGGDLLRVGDRHRRAAVRPLPAAVHAGRVVRRNRAERIAGKFPPQRAGRAGGAFLHAGDGDRHNLARKQRESRTGVGVADRMAKPGKAAGFGVGEGQGAMPAEESRTQTPARQVPVSRSATGARVVVQVSPSRV